MPVLLPVVQVLQPVPGRDRQPVREESIISLSYRATGRKEENMSYGEEARKEAATIAPRTLTLRLSDEDCRKLMEMAGAVGLSANELLQRFVADLANEQASAQAWFDHSGFEQFADNTLLRHLLKHDNVDDFLIRYEILMDCQEDLLAAEPYDSPENNRQEIAYQQSWLQSYYNDYVHYAEKLGTKPEPYDEALARILRWEEERNDLLKGRPGRSRTGGAGISA